MGNKHIFKFYCCFCCTCTQFINNCIPMSKPKKNDVELWIGDKLPINYLRGRVDNFSLREKSLMENSH